MVEQGTHAQLLAARGVYADLYDAQFAAAAADPEADPAVVWARDAAALVRFGGSPRPLVTWPLRTRA
jgi:ATP-binding cassette subfamily B protein